MLHNQSNISGHLLKYKEMKTPRFIWSWHII